MWRDVDSEDGTVVHRVGGRGREKLIAGVGGDLPVGNRASACAAQIGCAALRRKRVAWREADSAAGNGVVSQPGEDVDSIGWASTSRRSFHNCSRSRSDTPRLAVIAKPDIEGCSDASLTRIDRTLILSRAAEQRIQGRGGVITGGSPGRKAPRTGAKVDAVVSVDFTWIHPAASPRYSGWVTPFACWFAESHGSP